MAMQPYGGAMNRKAFSAQGMAGSTAGGGMRSNGNAPAMATPGFNPQAQMPVPVTGKYRGYFGMLAQGRANQQAAAQRKDVGYQVGQFQGYAQQGVDAQMERAGDDLSRRYGSMLGDLNSIGGLRSGGVQQGMMGLQRDYARQASQYAREATLGAIGMGQEESDREVERGWRSKQYKDQKRSSKRKMLGGLLGAAASFIPGVGPALGAGIGAVSR